MKKLIDKSRNIIETSPAKGAGFLGINRISNKDSLGNAKEGIARTHRLFCRGFGKAPRFG
tara:strand:+ start:1436 stop:1615 length:180 start_codon:yes stop_codon:yes gene_type:complete